MTRRRWKWLLVVTAVALLAWGYDRLNTTFWVGNTDLTVEFVVADSQTGRPVSGAKVDVEYSDGYYGQANQPPVHWTANENGLASEVLGCQIFGTASGLGFTDEFTVENPVWRYRVVADGYEPSGWLRLDTAANRQQPRLIGPRRSLIRVPIFLRKTADTP